MLQKSLGWELDRQITTLLKWPFLTDDVQVFSFVVLLILNWIYNIQYLKAESRLCSSFWVSILSTEYAALNLTNLFGEFVLSILPSILQSYSGAWKFVIPPEFNLHLILHKYGLKYDQIFTQICPKTTWRELNKWDIVENYTNLCICVAKICEPTPLATTVTPLLQQWL